jgi:hypothetical protein
MPARAGTIDSGATGSEDAAMEQSFHERQKIWVEQTDGSQREAIFVGEAELSSWFGIWHWILRRRYGEPRASLGFFATLMTATLSLFPILGRTPAPWRWPRDTIATAVGTHVAYVAGLAIAEDRLNR